MFTRQRSPGLKNLSYKKEYVVTITIWRSAEISRVVAPLFTLLRLPSSPYINQFLSADTIVPDPTNPQDLNRFSYVRNNPLKYTDPSGHDPWWCQGASCVQSYSTSMANAPSQSGNRNRDEHNAPAVTITSTAAQTEVPFISYSNEDGVCITVYCSGGESYSQFWYEHVLPLRIKDLKWLSDVFGFGTDTYDYWTGNQTSPKIGFGLDVATQLLVDASRDDLTLDQRLARAGVNGVEGMSISAISASVATSASEAVLAPSISLAVRSRQIWIPPVAVVATWATTYVATNLALSYVADRVNSNIPYLGP